jgi:hypothetical protein
MRPICDDHMAAETDSPLPRIAGVDAMMPFLLAAAAFSAAWLIWWYRWATLTPPPDGPPTDQTADLLDEIRTIWWYS